MLKMCKGCGGEFKGRRSAKYCSRECLNNPTIPNGHHCRICEVPLAGDKTVYCSEECYVWGRNRNKTFICQYCDEEYQAHKPTSKYCSYDCANAAQLRPDIQCEWCGDWFYPGRNDRIYCSRECSGRASRVTLDLPEYRHFRGRYLSSARWQDAREHALERDNWECQVCYEVAGLVIHHIIPLVEFWPDNLEASERPENLITLCQSCHPKVERGHIECPEPLD